MILLKLLAPNYNQIQFPLKRQPFCKPLFHNYILSIFYPVEMSATPLPHPLPDPHPQSMVPGHAPLALSYMPGPIRSYVTVLLTLKSYLH